MAYFKQRKTRGGTVYDVIVRQRGMPTLCKCFRDKAQARLWAARIEARAKGRAFAASRATTLDQLIDDATGGAQPRLTNPVKAAFKYWRSSLGHLRLSDIEPAILAHHRDILLGASCGGYRHRKLKPRSPATVKNYLIELSRLFTYAIKELGVMEANPVQQLTKPPASREVVRFLSDDERARLLHECKASDSKDLYPFVLFALTTGARKGEIATLEWTRVDLRRRWAIFPRTKNGDARGVPLTATVADLLAQRPRTSPLVFPHDITRAWHGAVARADLVDFRFHDLRHSCASALVQNGANLAEVATLLGHRGLGMTLRYAHVGNAGTLRLVDRVMGEVS